MLTLYDKLLYYQVLVHQIFALEQWRAAELKTIVLLYRKHSGDNPKFPKAVELERSIMRQLSCQVHSLGCVETMTNPTTQSNSASRPMQRWPKQSLL
jgi:hypothetical protein